MSVDERTRWRGPYRINGEDESAYQQRLSNRWCPQPPCQCGCGAGAMWNRNKSRWAVFAKDHRRPPKPKPPRKAPRICVCCEEVIAGATRGSYCKRCYREYHREWKKRNPEKHREYLKRQGERRRTDEFRAKQREYRKNNRERVNETSRRYVANNRGRIRANAIRRQYGLTVEEYETRIAAGCAICGNHGPKMAMDHDHGTGKTRDALCSHCNMSLGLMRDNPELLRAAAAYLETHHAAQNGSGESHGN